MVAIIVRARGLALAGLVSSCLVGASARAVEFCDPPGNGLLESVLSGVDPCGFYPSTFADAVETCGDETLSLEGTPGMDVDCEFCFWAEMAGYESEFGLVRLDEIPVPPGDPAFRDAALNAPSATTVFRGRGANDEPGARSVVRLEAGRDYVFWFVQDATLADAIVNPGIPVFFSATAANSDGVDHVKSLSSAANGGAVVFAWEDLVGGGDRDYTDTVTTTICSFIEADPCVQASALARPADVGDALRAWGGTQPSGEVTATLDWSLDDAAPRPDGEHYHVYAGDEPWLLVLQDELDLGLTSWFRTSPPADAVPHVRYYEVVAADACEVEGAY